MSAKTEEFRVHYRTEHSSGHVAVKAAGSKDAMTILGRRMPNVVVTRAEKVR